MWISLLFYTFLTFLAYLGYNLYYWRNHWPAFIWYRHLRLRLYVAGDLNGWWDIPNLSEDWYTYPISYEEYVYRHNNCEWVASRSAIQEGYGNLQPVFPPTSYKALTSAYLWYIWSELAFIPPI